LIDQESLVMKRLFKLFAIFGLVVAAVAAPAFGDPVMMVAADAALSTAAPAAGPADTTTAAAVAPAPASAPADASPPGTETISNPYGLNALWAQGDFVARGTLVILLIMSFGTWYILITKLIEQGKLLSQAKAATKTFWNTDGLQEGIGTLKEGSAFRFIAETGQSASEHHEGALVERIDLSAWITMSIQRAVDKVNSKLKGGLAFLATVGSTAPFVGLFGTVWGIYHALTAIGIAGQASIDKVAGPVGEALIMTAVGLAVAVPAVLAYNWLVRRNSGAMEQVRTFGSDLHQILIGGVGPRLTGGKS
jgi:biopolymer transport protein ExbB